MAHLVAFLIKMPRGRKMQRQSLQGFPLLPPRRRGLLIRPCALNEREQGLMCRLDYFHQQQARKCSGKTEGAGSSLHCSPNLLLGMIPSVCIIRELSPQQPTEMHNFVLSDLSSITPSLDLCCSWLICFRFCVPWAVYSRTSPSKTQTL